MIRHHAILLILALTACSTESSVIAVQPVWWPPDELAGVNQAVREWQYVGCPLILAPEAPHGQLMLVDEMPAVAADLQLVPMAAGQLVQWADGKFVVYVLRVPSTECTLPLPELRRRVLLHELGHVCGENDTTDPTSVMHHSFVGAECLSARIPGAR